MVPVQGQSGDTGPRRLMAAWAWRVVCHSPVPSPTYHVTAVMEPSLPVCVTLLMQCGQYRSACMRSGPNSEYFIAFVESVTIFSYAGHEGCREMTRGGVPDTSYVLLWQPLLEECVRRVAMFICQEKVTLEPLKPFGNFEVINLSGFFLYSYYYPALLIFPMCKGFFLINHVGSVG